MAKFKTLNNRVARFIIQNSVTGNPKFTFIRLYNAMKDREFDFDVLIHLFDLTKSILIHCHDIADIINAIDDCPVSVRIWLFDFKNTLKQLEGGVENE